MTLTANEAEDVWVSGHIKRDRTGICNTHTHTHTQKAPAQVHTPTRSLGLFYQIIDFSKTARSDEEGEEQMWLEDKQKKLQKSLNAGVANLLGKLRSH